MPEFSKDKLERSEIEEGLTLAGLWGMIDPPREESIDAVKDAKGAGIKPVMITGDHAVTALAITRSVGIVDDGNAVTGREIDGMEKPGLAEAALKNGGLRALPRPISSRSWRPSKKKDTLSP